MPKQVFSFIKSIAKSKKRLGTVTSGLLQPLSAGYLYKLFIVSSGQLNGLNRLTDLVG